MTEGDSVITDELRAWVGRTETYTAPEPIGRASLRYFALAVGDQNPLYVDVDAAAEAGYRDVVAPPTFVCESVQYMDGTKDEEGYAGHTWPLPVPEGYRTVRGGNHYQFHQAAHPDDQLTVTWTLQEISEKKRMIFCISVVEYRNQRDELIAVNNDTIIYVPPRSGS